MNGTMFDKSWKTKSMKTVILFLVLTFGVTPAFAECSLRGMQFFPEQKEISLNSMFIIQGYALSQKTINSFKNRTIYLESEKGELIELNLQEILKGHMELTQAIFCPNSSLKPNTTYFLKYADQTEFETQQMNQWNSETKKNENVSWKTASKKTAEPLNSTMNVRFEKTEVVLYGCGPSSNAIFIVKSKSKPEVWFKTE